MVSLYFGAEPIAHARPWSQIPMTLAECMSAIVQSDIPALEVSLDAIIGFIVLAALIGISPSLCQRAYESGMHLQRCCCKRSVRAAAGSWPTQSALAARRTGNEEKLFLIDVFKGHAEAGNIKGMMQLLQEVENHWLPHLNMQDYHCFIQFLGRGGQPVAAHMWLRRSMSAGFKPFHRTFNAVISSYIKKRSLEQALRVADEMRSAVVDYDTATYNMVIDVWARKGDADSAQSWMRRMLDEGIQPNIIGFSTVMRTCAEAGFLKDLERWFETSQSYGFKLDLLGFRSVLRAFAKKEDAVNAAKWLDLMIDQGVQPGVIEFMEVLKPILKHDDMRLAIRLMGQVRAVGVWCPAVMIGECIVMAVKHGHYSKAQTWADESAARKVGVGEAAKIAMVEAGLTVPVFDMGNRENSPQESFDARAEGGAPGPNAEANMAARDAAVGCHYVGVVKESNPYRYGFITCDATFQVFKHDVWFSQEENREGLTKGQTVSFRLRVDDKGRPRACDMTLSR